MVFKSLKKLTPCPFSEEAERQTNHPVHIIDLHCVHQEEN